MTAISELAGLVRRCRMRSGLTIEELADASGVSVRAISNIERGVSRAPHLRNLVALADAMKVEDRERSDLTNALRAERRRPAAAPTIGPFIGRTDELRAIRAVLQRPGAANAIVLVTGAPGVGKTRLVEHAAAQGHDVPSREPVVVNLRGLEPILPDQNQLLARLLVGLGVAPVEIPSSTQAREDLYRELLGEHRQLIVLDNAADADQLRPFLPSTGQSTIVITSRLALREIDATLRLDLGQLSVTDSVRLIRQAVDRSLNRGERRGTVELAALCVGSPLALSIAAARLRGARAWTVEDLVARLRDANERLATLGFDDVRVESSFEVSYRQLSRRARTVLVYSTTIPAPSARTDLLAVASGFDIAATELALDELADASLLERTVGSRYRAHDLTRLFASSRLTRDCDTTDVAAARQRTSTWLLDTVVAMGSWFHPDQSSVTDLSTAPQDAEQSEASMDAAGAWLREEIDNWYPALRHTAAAGSDHVRVLRAVLSLDWASDLMTHWRGWADVARLGRSAAVSLGDPRGEARCLGLESWALMTCTPDYRASIDRARRSFDLAGTIGDINQQGWARFYEADAQRLFGHPDRGLAPARQATELFRECSDNTGLVQALVCVGICLNLMDAHAEALFEGQHLLAYLRSPDGRPRPEQLALYNEGSALTCIGRAQRALGEVDESICAFTRAAELIGRTGYLRGRVIALLELATSLEAVGRSIEALNRLDEAYQLMTSLGMRPTPELLSRLRQYAVADPSAAHRFA